MSERELNPDTDMLVDRFAEALKDKLAKAERKYGYGNGWKDDHWQADLIAKLKEHVGKGDPRDVAAYCAFAWHHGWSISEAKADTILSPRGEQTEAVAWSWELSAFNVWRPQLTHDRPEDGTRVRNVQPLYAHPAGVEAPSVVLRLSSVVRAMLDAIKDGEIDSPVLEGEPEVGIPPHRWHEEWAANAEYALAALSPQALGEDSGA